MVYIILKKMKIEKEKERKEILVILYSFLNKKWSTMIKRYFGVFIY